MGIASNIVLADALGTPVNHTFIPIGPQKNYDMVWEDQSQASPNGFWRIGVKASRPDSKVAGGAVRVQVTLLEPVLEAIAPAASGLTQPPTVAFTPKVITEYIISDRSSLQQRKDLRKMNYNLQNDSQVVAWVENFIPSW